ncbi:PAS domain-containing sensor histidine kinase [Egibacter rhizosphaerae]|uniref:histidine kinase n=1 Tax=Egibacter rhizosphaerae TaxID=1670831 RepID=A0A411YK17_9ACTN|nr:HAMP domain-containing sensor histidine kinase [Egibacter rhizosphaerae]QBI21559.1 PAS domain-containing sensor histidine kinase [Egibacter rhizosphaerae]
MSRGHGHLPDTATLELLPDPVVVVDGRGLVTAANELAVRLLGADPRGARADEMIALRDEAGHDWWTTDCPQDGDASVRHRIPERDLWLEGGGRARPVTLTGARQRDATGAVGLVLCLRRAERRQRLDAARSDLVATVSHELRSPLTAVKGFTKTLLAKWDRFTDDQKRQMLTTVNADADRVTRLLGELLDVSRIDAGRLKLQRAPVSLGGLAARVADRFAADDGVHEHDAATVRVRDPRDLPRVHADEDKLEQVLTNLVENATKYGAGRIEIVLTAGEQEIGFSVTDQGGEIAPEHLDHLFTKFYRRSGERHTGTGLGLYISKGIVEAHGGRIWAESDPAEGTRFHVRLPRAPEFEAPSQAAGHRTDHGTDAGTPARPTTDGGGEA